MIEKYEQEVLNRWGEKLLKKIKEHYPSGFRIIGNTGKTVVVGDEFKNTEFTIKSGRVRKVS